MAGELHDNAEAKSITQSGAESSRLVVTNGDMATFQGQQRGGVSVTDREHAMFANGGLDFGQAGNIYATTETGGKTIRIGDKDYPAEDVTSRDWGAALKKGWDRTVQSAQNPDLIHWENPPEGGDQFYPRRGREDEFIDYDACAKANTAFPGLAKYIGDGPDKVDPDLIAATIRNEQYWFDNRKDAGPENYAQKHGNWPFNQDESLGPAQMQVQNMEHLAAAYPKQLGAVADAVRNGIDTHHAPDFVGAYFADVIHGIESKQKPDYISDNIWKQVNDRWQKGQRNEALIIAYNPDPNQINHVFTQLDNIKAPDWD